MDKILDVSTTDICEDQMHSIILQNEARKVKFQYRCLKRRFIYGETPSSSCPDKGTNCNSCDRVMSKFFIFGIESAEELENYSDLIWKDKETFEKFQGDYISKLFFQENVVVRYNTYLLFWDKVSACYSFSSEKFREIENDTRFARKVFLYKEEYDEFFRDALSRFDSGSLVITTKESSSNEGQATSETANDSYIDSVKKIAVLFRKFGLMSALVDRSYSREKVFNNMRNYQSSNKEQEYAKNSKSYDYEYFCNNLASKSVPNGDTFVSKYFMQESQVSDEKTVSKTLLHIKRISTRNYREESLGREMKTIELCKVNVICGNNSSGKTSLLDSIKYALTGRDSGNNSTEGKLASVDFSNCEHPYSSSVSEDDVIERKSQFYPGISGQLDELFVCLNYFNLDAAYRFALGFSDMISNLFAERPILRAKERITDITNYVNEMSKYYKPLSDKKMLEEEAKKKIKTRLHKSLRNKLKAYTKGLENAVDELAKILIDVLEDQKNQLQSITEDSPEVEHIRQFCDEFTASFADIESNLQLSEYDFYKQVEKNRIVINKIYRKLHSFREEIYVHVDPVDASKSYIGVVPAWSSSGGKIHIEDKHKHAISIRMMSTGQKICLGLAIMFSQFLSHDVTLKFILLDESVANLDAVHLLNLFDFLRELAIQDVQIVFSTANPWVEDIADIKFSFLGDTHYMIKSIAEIKSELPLTHDEKRPNPL